MYELVVEKRQLNNKLLSRDLAELLFDSTFYGKVVVVTDNPVVLHSTIRRRWQYITRRLQVNRSRTLNHTEIDSINNQLDFARSIRFSSSPPKDDELNAGCPKAAESCFMDKSSPLITTGDILPHLKFIRTKKQEYVLCLSLDSGCRLIARRVVTIGTLTSSLIHPREIFAAPLKDRAASVVIAHNHPSGDANPGRADIAVTQQLVAAGQILGIAMRDHLIITKEESYSFRGSGLLLD